MPQNLQSLENALGYTFKSAPLLQLALKHSSLALGVNDNQRLEFLGDSVLGLIIAEALYQSYPELEEGALDRMRASIVSGKSLTRKARALDLGKYLQVSEAQRRHHAEPSAGMLEDALEAIIGAIYLDGGFTKAQATIRQLFYQEIRESNTQLNSATPKSQLQEWTQKHHNGQKPTYRQLASSGPDHNKSYQATVEINDKQIGKGSGSSKKAAEIDAAANALKTLLA